MIGAMQMAEQQQAQLPAFDKTTWQAAVDQAGGLESMVKKLREQFSDPAERAQIYMKLSSSQIVQLPIDEQRLVWDKSQHNEIQKLLDLSLSKIEKLPQDLKERVWQELAREVLESPELNGRIIFLENVSKEIAEAFESVNDAIGHPSPQIVHVDTPAEDQQPAAEGTDTDKEGSPAADSKTQEQTRRERIRDARKRRDKAQQAGALMTATKRLPIIADKDLGFGYFTREVIKKLPKEISEQAIDKKTGQITLYDLTGGTKLQEVDWLHTGFLMLLFSLALNNSDIRETNSSNAIIPIYLPAVLDQMGIDPRPRTRDKKTKQLVKRDAKSRADARFEKFMEFMRPLDNVAAWFGNDLYPVARFVGYESESQTYSIIAPYMFKLVEYAKLHATKHGAISNVFHADIMTENQAAVEIANRIAMGLILRGVTRPDGDTYQSTTDGRKPLKKKKTVTNPDGTKTVEELTFAQDPNPDLITKSRTDENGITTTITGTKKKPKTFTYRVKFSTLLDDCPDLQRELDAIRNSIGAAEAAAREAEAEEDEVKAARQADHKTDPQRINKKLKDVFAAAVRIITEKSDIPQYYAGLTIRTGRFPSFKAPTNSTLNEYLIMTHSGKNPSFDA